MKINVLRNVFEHNDRAAAENRQRLNTLGVTCINLLGSAGSGKTSVLEAVLPTLTDSLSVAVLEGDLATTVDAERIAALDLPVVQLLTDGGCHLNATIVQHAFDRIPLADLDLLIIENVGNPICPANFDLGEHLRISILSVTEGHDKPAKYPLLFKEAALVLLTKCDLLPHTDFDIAVAQQELRRINPNAEVISTNVKTRSGFDRLAEWIRARHTRPVAR